MRDSTSVWLLDGGLTLIFAATLSFVAVIPIINQIYKTYGRFQPWPAFLAFASLASLCSIAIFTLAPFPLAKELSCEAKVLTDYWQTVPFLFVSDFADKISQVGPLRFFISNTFLQVAFNIALFAPLGFLLHQIFRWKFWQVALTGFGVSLLVEAAQGTALLGAYPCPYRVADIDDLILNTLGGMCGYVVSRLFNRWIPLKAPTTPVIAANPTLTRRSFAVFFDMMAMIITGLVIAIAARTALMTSIGLTPAEIPGWIDPACGGVAVILVGLCIPLLRKDSATPGQATVNLVPVIKQYQRSTTLLRRFAARWVIYMMAPQLFTLVLLGEYIWTARHPERRSFANLVSGSDTAVASR